jgi:hypothetical protein
MRIVFYGTIFAITILEHQIARLIMSNISDVAFSIHNPTERFGTKAKVGSVKLPDFNKMYTKKESPMSDEEIKEAISKIAREDAEKGQFHNKTKEYYNLKKEYLSSVSPDRESIVTNSTKQIFANANSINSKNKERTTLLEFLINKDKDNKTAAININGSGYKASLEGGELTYAGFYSNGELIADYDNKNGWSDALTRAEGARLIEFTKMYNEAWNSVNAEINKSVPKHLEGGAAFDSYA